MEVAVAVAVNVLYCSSRRRFWSHAHFGLPHGSLVLILVTAAHKNPGSIVDEQTIADKAKKGSWWVVRPVREIKTEVEGIAGCSSCWY